jgi:hypothetical protein
MVILLGHVIVDRLKELSSTLYDRPIEEENPCQMHVDIVGMIKDRFNSSVRKSYYFYSRLKQA